MGSDLKVYIMGSLDSTWQNGPLGTCQVITEYSDEDMGIFEDRQET